MANIKTLYLAKDGTGTFLFTTRPVWEEGNEEEVGIWSESSDGKLLLQLSNGDCRDMLGFIPDDNTCWDVSFTSTMIERAPDA